MYNMTNSAAFIPTIITYLKKTAECMNKLNINKLTYSVCHCFHNGL